MGKNWKNALCSTCIASLVKEESASVCDDLVASVKKELYATIQSFRDSLVNPAASQPSTSESSQVSLSVPENLSEGPSTRSQSPAPSNDGSEEEEGEGAEAAPSNFKLSLEEVDGLLRAIHVTLGLS